MKIGAVKTFSIVFIGMFVLNTLAEAQSSKKFQDAKDIVKQTYADYVFKNGAIYTMDKQNPQVAAIAIMGKKISFLGTNEAVNIYIGKDTKVTDLEGKMLLPGFVESHMHPTSAFVVNGADLQCETVDQILARVTEWADKNPDAKVIRGFGWRYFLFPDEGPDKSLLDKLFPDRPVLLFAIDGHSAWVNSKALKMAKVDATTADPVPGFSYFQRNPTTNEATGWLVEVPALMYVFNKLAPPSPEAIAAAMHEEFQKIAAAGITSVYDAGINALPMEKGLDIYQQMEKKGTLPMRVVSAYYWNDANILNPVDLVLKLRSKYNSALVQVKDLKINIDGGESQHTAVMLKPYHDRPGYNSGYIIPPANFAKAILKAQSIGMNTHAHSYGDSATRVYLNAIEAAKKAYPNSKSRHTAAHALFITDAEVSRMAKLDVTFQTTPQWLVPDPTIALMVKILGEDVVFHEYGRINSVLQAGGRVSFGSDWPVSGWVSTLKPLDAIQAAVTRKVLPQYGTQQIRPVMAPENECISLEQAIKASTIDAAYVLGLENKTGSLKVGKAADIVILEKDINKLAVSEISKTKIMLTMMNGKITYQEK